MSRRGRESSPFSLFSFQDIITSVTGIMILVTLLLALELLHRKDSPPRMTARIAEELRSTLAQSEGLRASIDQTQTELESVAGLDVSTATQRIAQLDRLTEQLRAELEQSRKERNNAIDRRQELEKVKTQRASDPDTIRQMLDEARAKEQLVQQMKSQNRTIYNRPADASKVPWLVELSDKSILVAQLGKREPAQTYPNTSAFLQWARGRDRTAEYFVLIVKPSAASAFDEVSQRLKNLRFEIGFDLLAENETAVSVETGAVVQ